MFLQGFAANLSAALTRKTSFSLRSVGGLVDFVLGMEVFVRDAGVEGAKRIADRLAGELMGAERQKIVGSPINGRRLEVALPLDLSTPAPLPSINDATRGDAEAYCRSPEGSAPRRILRVQRLRVGPLLLIAVGAEILTEYAIWLRHQVPADMMLIPVSCAGGMLGYIPDATALAQGGYEPHRSCALFGQPYEFSPQVERLVKDTLRAAVRD